MNPAIVITAALALFSTYFVAGKMLDIVVRSFGTPDSSVDILTFQLMFLNMIPLVLWGTVFRFIRQAREGRPLNPCLERDTEVVKES